MLGRVNAIWAAAADEAYFVVAGADAEAPMSAYDEASRAYDAKTKPRGSLGRLEELGCRIARDPRRSCRARLEAAIVVAAADHGVAAEGVSAYPQEVTAQMVANFAAGGAAINVLARQAGARLVVVDAGVAVPFEHERVRSVRHRAGTANIARGPAMTARAGATRRSRPGRSSPTSSRDVDVVALGEMGIGNTTAASALTRGAPRRRRRRSCAAAAPGLDDDGVARKVDAVAAGARGEPSGDRSAARRARRLRDRGPRRARARLRRERRRRLLDGFITARRRARRGAARRRASLDVHDRVAPLAEPGHALVLDALGLEPLLDLGLRLGEGTGAALALPLAATRRSRSSSEMATFDDAGVTDAGR